MVRYLTERITVNPEICHGRPCIRGMRIRVVDVLELLASGMSADEILEDYPDLEKEDILDVLQFAANHIGASDFASNPGKISQTEMAELRARLETFAADWDSPEMSIYDNYDVAKAKQKPQ